MATWQQFSYEAPELAAAVRARFDATKHHVLATLRRDGSPRVSGTEVVFEGPDLALGMMPDSMKALDLRRDGRFALHANPGDGSMEGGDAKVAGIAEADLDHVSPMPSHFFRLDLGEVVLTTVDVPRELLVVQTWRPGRGVRRVERA